MTTAKLNAIVQSMASNRPFFYSEADFQHSLALALKANGYEVFLEYPVNREHIDIIAKKNGKYYPIELKYRTKSFNCSGLCNTMCILKDQNARDIGRYDLWEDVKRIEYLRKGYQEIGEGYAIILTNDLEYWTAPSSPRSELTIDRDFKLHKGMNVKDVFWHNIPAKVKNDPDYVAGTTVYKGFSLNKKYNVPSWIDYSTILDPKTNRPLLFKYLIINV